MKISIQTTLKNKKAIIRNLQKILDQLVFRLSGCASIIIVDDKQITKLSGEFRGEFHRTDVITFSLGDKQIDGEIYISLDTALVQARTRRITPLAELTMLAVHGIMHLCGLRDETKSDWCSMRLGEYKSLLNLTCNVDKLFKR